MNKIEFKNIFVIGFAVFAMFFGAGNLIFPPYLGLVNAQHWFLSFLCFIVMDMGLSILALLVITKIGRGTEGVTEKLGKHASMLILSLNAVCLGPLIAIPRTAATAFEFSIAPFFSEIDSRLFSAIFFLIVVLFCLKQSKVIDIIGTFFAPLILAALLVLIIKGITTPLGAAQIHSLAQNAVRDGINAGYQTMDVMAAMIFSTTILMGVTQKGYTDSKRQFKMVAASGMLATLILFIVYGGLAYLGSTVSGSYSQEINRVELLIAITRALLGEKGTILLGVLVCAACLTPAIGLLSSSAAFFEKQTSGRIKYRTFVLVFAIVSCIISNFGIEKILALASPILSILYPVLVLMIFMGLMGKRIPSPMVIRFAAFGSAVISGVSVLEAYVDLPFTVTDLPFYSYGFYWVLPAVVCGMAGAALSGRKLWYNALLNSNIAVRT